MIKAVNSGTRAHVQNNQLLEITIKLTILVTGCVLSTLTILIPVLYAVTGDNVYVVTTLIIMIDAFINTVCFTLQFGFNKKWYFMVCGCCQRQCTRLVVRHPENQIAIPDRDLELDARGPSTERHMHKTRMPVATDTATHY